MAITSTILTKLTCYTYIHRPACWNFSLATSSLCPSKMAMLKLASWWPLHTNRDNANLSSHRVEDCSPGSSLHFEFYRLYIFSWELVPLKKLTLFSKLTSLIQRTNCLTLQVICLNGLGPEILKIILGSLMRNVYFLLSLLVFKFLHCIVIFKIENNVF